MTISKDASRRLLGVMVYSTKVALGTGLSGSGAGSSSTSFPGASASTPVSPTSMTSSPAISTSADSSAGPAVIRTSGSAIEISSI